MAEALTLGEWRKKEGLSQRDTAALLSTILGRTVHQPSIVQWEAGEVMPGADVAEAIRTMTGDLVTGGSFGKR